VGGSVTLWTTNYYGNYYGNVILLILITCDV